MRAHAISISILLLVPLAAGLSVPRAPTAAIDALAVPPLPVDLPDAALMLMLARLDHPDVRLVPRALPAPGDTLALAATRVGASAGVALTAEDRARFDALDPSIQAPLLTLFVTIEQANGMIASARADLTDEEAHRMITLRHAGQEGSPEFRALAEQIDVTTLLNAGILVTDTVEAIVVPALESAIASGAWPAAGAWDPVGVLRLGSIGNDLETLDRIVQIDPSGSDVYKNNAGGATTFDPLNGGFNIVSPIAISIDFAGNDQYDARGRVASSLGGSEIAGFGLLYDLREDDDYFCRVYCMGSGFGILKDRAGADEYIAGSRALGVGSPLGVLREEEGGDSYWIAGFAGGYSPRPGSIGLLWDRAGRDHYGTDGFNDDRLGWAEGDGRGLFADEGPEMDTYETTQGLPVSTRHGCNDCTWLEGEGHLLPRPGGRGNDNSGGLAAVLADIGP